MRSIIFAATVAGIGFASGAQAVMLETETVRLLPQGGIKLGGAYEFQTSSEGKEQAIPLEFEYGLSKRLELVIEPVAFASVRPKNRKGATGNGDTEVTLLYQFADESDILPAMGIAGEVKLPTTHNPQLGSGKADYATIFVASKKFGALDVHGNLSYTVYGQPKGATGNLRLKNRVGVALAGVYTQRDWQYFAEAFSNSLFGGSSGEADATNPNVPPALQEASGGESFGTVGVAKLFGPNIKASFSITGTNSGAVLFRPGIELKF